MSGRRSVVSAVLPAVAIGLLSGWLTAQSFPLRGPRALAFVALVPLFACARVVPARVAAAVGAVWMLAFAWGINAWFPRAVAMQFELPWAGGFAAFLAVTVFTAAPATALTAVVLSRLGPSPRAGAALVTAAAWTAGELLRVRVLGDPWGLLAHSQGTVPLWLQTADLAGVYGPGFVVASVNAGLAELLLLAVHHRPLARTAWRIAATAAAVPLLAAAYGAWRLAAPPSTATSLDVALVQGNVDFRRQWEAASHGPNLAHYRDETRRALDAAPARLVVWPENAVTFFLEDEEPLRRTIAPVLSPRRAFLLAGAPRYLRGDGAAASFRNAAVLLDSEAAVIARYDKQRLLPFGEYWPFGVADAAANASATAAPAVAEFSPGPLAQPPLDAGAAKLGVVICNEALFADPAASRVAAGANLLVALTNDSWVGEPDFAEQAFEQSILRAVEQRRWLLRSSTSGPSAAVDDRGRVVARTAYATTASLAATVRLEDGRTPYSRAGDAFAIGCALAAASAARRRRDRQTPA